MSDRSSARRNMKYGQGHELGAQMRLHRKAAKISLREMSEKTGRPKSTLADAETGWVKPSQDLLKTYEETLALPKGTLITEAAPIASSVENPFTSPGPGNHTDLMVHAAIPQEPIIIDDEIQCRELIISLLLRTSAQPREIVLMMANPPAHLGELRKRWFGALAKALEHQDHITHIWTPPPNLQNSHMIVQNMLYLSTLGQKLDGQYTILFLPDAFLLWSLPYELFVISNEAAVELFGKWQGGYTDSAIFYPAKTSSDFVRHFRSYISMLKSMAEPLVKTYPLYGSPELAKVILDAEQLDGEELLVVTPISDKTMPGTVRRARMQRILSAINDPGFDDWLRDDYAFCEQRRHRFEERVRRWPVRHLLYRQALEGMARENQFRDSKTDRFGAIAELKPEEIRLCIRQLIDDLHRFPNYEVALTAEPLQEGPQSYCEVVGDICLFVIAEARKALLNVTIKQKRVLQLQKNHFAHQWALLQKADKDKAEVGKFLSNLIGGE
jgi:transcriptional regulator with XRE-family HTH domain